MAQVTISINSREYAIAREDGLYAAEGVVRAGDIVRHVLEEQRVVIAPVGLQHLGVERRVHDYVSRECERYHAGLSRRLRRGFRRRLRRGRRAKLRRQGRGQTPARPLPAGCETVKPAWYKLYCGKASHNISLKRSLLSRSGPASHRRRKRAEYALTIG